jgi:hypothetical protein
VFAGLEIDPESLPVTEALQHEVLSLPMGPHLSDDQVEYVVDAIRAFDAWVVPPVTVSAPTASAMTQLVPFHTQSLRLGLKRLRNNSSTGMRKPRPARPPRHAGRYETAASPRSAFTSA